MNTFPIRAKTPKGFDIARHRVTKFKRNNYDNFYTLDSDGYYTYKGDNADYHYSEGALLGLSDITVIDYSFKF